MLFLLLAYVGGVLTILSPCILPVLQPHWAWRFWLADKYLRP